MIWTKVFQITKWTSYEIKTYNIEVWFFIIIPVYFKIW